MLKKVGLLVCVLFLFSAIAHAFTPVPPVITAYDGDTNTLNSSLVSDNRIKIQSITVTGSNDAIGTYEPFQIRWKEPIIIPGYYYDKGVVISTSDIADMNYPNPSGKENLGMPGHEDIKALWSDLGERMLWAYSWYNSFEAYDGLEITVTFTVPEEVTVISIPIIFGTNHYDWDMYDTQSSYPYYTVITEYPVWDAAAIWLDGENLLIDCANNRIGDPEPNLGPLNDAKTYPASEKKFFLYDTYWSWGSPDLEHIPLSGITRPETVYGTLATGPNGLTSEITHTIRFAISDLGFEDGTTSLFFSGMKGTSCIDPCGAGQDITLSNNRIVESVCGATNNYDIVGTFSVSGLCQTENIQWNLMDDAYGAFDIIGDTLVIKDASKLDHATRPTMSITVKVNDSSGLQPDIQKTFFIDVDKDWRAEKYQRELVQQIEEKYNGLPLQKISKIEETIEPINPITQETGSRNVDMSELLRILTDHQNYLLKRRTSLFSDSGIGLYLDSLFTLLSLPRHVVFKDSKLRQADNLDDRLAIVDQVYDHTNVGNELDKDLMEQYKGEEPVLKIILKLADPNFERTQLNMQILYAEVMQDYLNLNNLPSAQKMLINMWANYARYETSEGSVGLHDGKASLAAELFSSKSFDSYGGYYNTLRSSGIDGLMAKLEIENQDPYLNNLNYFYDPTAVEEHDPSEAIHVGAARTITYEDMDKNGPAIIADLTAEKARLERIENSGDATFTQIRSILEQSDDAFFTANERETVIEMGKFVFDMIIDTTTVLGVIAKGGKAIRSVKGIASDAISFDMLPNIDDFTRGISASVVESADNIARATKAKSLIKTIDDQLSSLTAARASATAKELIELTDEIAKLKAARNALKTEEAIGVKVLDNGIEVHIDVKNTNDALLEPVGAASVGGKDIKYSGDNVIAKALDSEGNKRVFTIFDGTGHGKTAGENTKEVVEALHNADGSTLKEYLESAHKTAASVVDDPAKTGVSTSAKIEGNTVEIANGNIFYVYDLDSKIITKVTDGKVNGYLGFSDGSFVKDNLHTIVLDTPNKGIILSSDGLNEFFEKIISPDGIYLWQKMGYTNADDAVDSILKEIIDAGEIPTPEKIDALIHQKADSFISQNLDEWEAHIKSLIQEDADTSDIINAMRKKSASISNDDQAIVTIHNPSRKGVSIPTTSDSRSIFSGLDYYKDAPDVAVVGEEAYFDYFKTRVTAETTDFVESHAGALATAKSQLTDMYPAGKVEGRLKDTYKVEEKIYRDITAGELNSRDEVFEAVGLLDSKMRDLAGTRVTFTNIDDISSASSKIFEKIDSGEWQLLGHKDYINNPKAGYRAVHYIVGIDGKPVEIQFRTPEQTLWADWAHDTVYKGSWKNDEVAQEYAKATGDWVYNINKGIEAPMPACSAALQAAGLCFSCCG